MSDQLKSQTKSAPGEPAHRLPVPMPADVRHVRVALHGQVREQVDELSRLSGLLPGELIAVLLERDRLDQFRTSLEQQLKIHEERRQILAQDSEAGGVSEPSASS